MHASRGGVWASPSLSPSPARALHECRTTSPPRPASPAPVRHIRTPVRGDASPLESPRRPAYLRQQRGDGFVGAAAAAQPSSSSSPSLSSSARHTASSHQHNLHLQGHRPPPEAATASLAHYSSSASSSHYNHHHHHQQQQHHRLAAHPQPQPQKRAALSAALPSGAAAAPAPPTTAAESLGILVAAQRDNEAQKLRLQRLKATNDQRHKEAMRTVLKQHTPFEDIHLGGGASGSSVATAAAPRGGILRERDGVRAESPLAALAAAGAPHARGGGGGGGALLNDAFSDLLHSYSGVTTAPDNSSGCLKQEQWRYIFQLFYEKHNPDKVADLESILEHARGREALVYVEMQRKYGLVPPTPDLPPLPAPEPPATAHPLPLSTPYFGAPPADEEDTDFWSLVAVTIAAAACVSARQQQQQQEDDDDVPPPPSPSASPPPPPPGASESASPTTTASPRSFASPRSPASPASPATTRATTEAQSHSPSPSQSPRTSGAPSPPASSPSPSSRMSPFGEMRRRPPQ